MKTTWLRTSWWVRTCGLLLSWTTLAPGQPSKEPSVTESRAVIQRYCAGCHNSRTRTAGLALDDIDIQNPAAKAEAWEKVIRKLRTGAMPPAGVPRPTPAATNQLATYLETAIDRAAIAKPGRPALHRLNRAEYANAIRDLFGVSIDAEALLPPDGAAYGFDNVGAALTVSPALLERYLAAARNVSRLAVGNPSARPAVEIYEVSKFLDQSDRMDEDLPLASRGGSTFYHYFPADGEYVIKVHLFRDYGEGGYMRGADIRRRISILLDQANLKEFEVGGEQKGPAGSSAQEDYERRSADASLTTTVNVTAGRHQIGAAFALEQTSEPEGVFRPRVLGANPLLRMGKTSEPWVDNVSVDGPYRNGQFKGPLARNPLFTCNPGGAEQDSCASQVLSNLARHAYRRPATSSELSELMSFYKIGRKQGGFEDGIRLAIERLLVSVNFLFRVERDPSGITPNTNYRISDTELASRLSFFLWSSIPDDQLLALANQQQLSKPEILDAQVRRMLRDPKSQAFVENFFGQWLELRRVPDLTPDPLEYPSFDEDLRRSFRKETELFAASLFAENQPLVNILNADYTFLNERLAEHYGIPNVYGTNFRKVKIDDENRRGLLGQGSILTLTSYATRTSIVLRGVWVLDNILGNPPPPPPPNVPSLSDRSEDGRIKSVRQSMEEHRANPVCASCHARIDPIGFALENFDGIGTWRATEGPEHSPIDTSGVLPDGTKINGPAELRKVLASRPQEFATMVTEKLLTYALGRGVEPSDQPTVRRIVHTTAADDYRWWSIIREIVRSEQFQMRRSLP